MTDKKFTDEEIISSLELIATTRNCNECKIRNCEWGTCNCEQITDNAALDLVNRQKTTIKNLRNVISNQQMEVSAKIEKQIKSEAYKEFAEKLENICEEIMAQKWNGKTAPISWSYAYAGFIDDIDTLLKEMVGEEE